jgi:hypothetical protein
MGLKTTTALSKVRTRAIEILKKEKENTGVVPGSMVSLVLLLGENLSKKERQVLKDLEHSEGENDATEWLVETLKESGLYIDTGNGDVISIDEYHVYQAERQEPLGSA